MGRQFLDIENTQALAVKDVSDSCQREVGKMLVIDSVELVEVHKLLQVWKLHRDHTVFSQQGLEPADKIFQVRDMCQDIVADDQVGLAALRCQAIAQVSVPKNSTSDGTPTFSPAAATLAQGSMPSTGTPR